MILNDTQSLWHPSDSPRTQFLFRFSIVMLKRKINSSLTKKDKRCVIFIFSSSSSFVVFSEGWTWVFFTLNIFWREAPKGVFVFMANDNDVWFSSSFLLCSIFWWIFIRPILDVRVRKSRWDNLYNTNWSLRIAWRESFAANMNRSSCYISFHWLLCSVFSFDDWQW